MMTTPTLKHRLKSLLNVSRLRLFLAVALPLAAATAWSQPSTPSGCWAYANSSYNMVYWNAVPDATYDVYRGTAPGLENATPVATGQTGAQYEDTHVSAGVHYYYKVRAFYGTLDSGLSSECSAEPGQPQTTAPVAYGTSGADEAILSYAPVAGATFYRIFRSTFGGTPQLIATTASLGYEDAGLSDGVQYFYYVDSGSVNSEGGSSLTFSVIPGTQPPLTTTFIYASPSGGSNTTISWNPVPGATGYAVFRSTSHNGESQPLAVIQSGQSYTDSGLMPNTLYYYKVKTLDQSGASGLDTMEASAKSGAQELAGPQVAAASSASSITLNWTAVPDATSYVVFRYETSEGGDSVLAIKDTTATIYADSSVMAGVSYTYTICALSIDGLGFSSNPVSAVPGDPPLAAPTGVYATPGNSVYLSWNPAPGATSYNVYRSTTGTPTLFAAGVQPPLNDTLVTSTQRYYYEVKAVYSGTEGMPSSVVSVLPGSTPLPAPEVAPMQVSGHTTLYWGFVPGAASYDVLRTVEGSNYTAIATGIVPGAGSVYGAYTDAGAAAGVDYLYEVAAVDANGFGLPSIAVHAAANGATPPTTTGISASVAGNEIFVQWNSVGLLGSYVYRSTTAGGEGYVPIGYSGGTSFQDNSVSQGTTYYYKVRTTNGENVSAFSVEASAQAGVLPLAAPVLTGYSEAASAEIYWSPITGAASYNIYRAIGQNGNYTLYQKGVTATDFVDTNVVTANVYYYEIQAVRQSGAGTVSSAVSVRPDSTFTGFSSGIYAQSSNGGSNQIVWNPVPGAASYNLFRGTVSGGGGLTPIATGLNSPYYFDSSSTPGKLYYYTVTAVVLDGQGPQSAQASCLTGATPSGAPNLELGVVSSGRVSLVWNSGGAGIYDIFRQDPFTQEWVLLKMNIAISGETPSFEDTTVINGLTYHYEVASVSTDGISNLSEAVSATP